MNPSQKFLILFPFFINACTTLEEREVEISVPSPAIESPEIGGQPYRPIIGVRTQSMNKLNLAKKVSTRPPDLNSDNSSNTSLSSVGPYGGVQLADWMSLTAGFDGLSMFSRSPGFFTKYQMQLLGQPAVNADKGNFSLSTVFELQYSPYSRSGTRQDGNYTTIEYPWTATGSSQALLTSVSMGYRLQKEMMLFWGVGAGVGQAAANITHDPASDNSDSGGRYSVSQSFTTFSTAVGLDVTTWRHHFMPRAEIAWLLNNNNTTLTYKVMFEWRFDLFRSEKKSKSPAERKKI